MARVSTRKGRFKAYLYALGRFVVNFADVESSLHRYFHRFAKIEPEVANAIKRGMKASELIAIMKGLLEVHKFSDEDKAEANALFNHFADITSFRDRVIHRGGYEIEPTVFYSSNEATMRSIEYLEEARFTVQDIRNASYDLYRIGVRIQFLSIHFPRSRAARFVYAPWRYKPVQLKTPYLRRRGKPRLQPVRPSS